MHAAASVCIASGHALLENAEDVAPAFHKFLRALVEAHGGEYLQGPNKTRARAIEKIEGDYGGDHTKLVDAVRASAIFKTFAQLTLAVEALGGNAQARPRRRMCVRRCGRAVRPAQRA